MAPKRLLAADLFCGAGGSSTGLARACERAGLRLELLAVNHWETAVETHAANHPQATHLCETLDGVDPRRAVPGGRLDLLIASPECTHHSIARGGKPASDQSRASAWHVIRWADALRPKAILVENVREFQTWGPLGANGRPLRRRRGETFQAWQQALRSLGYSVSHRVLCAADYGDPTTRERLFVVAVRGRGPAAWPEPTHTAEPADTLFGRLPRWRAAREVIDWRLHGESIFGRKRPLSENTLRRIAAGLKRFCGLDFVFPTTHHGGDRVRSVDEPLPTVTGANRGEYALAQPFVLGQQSGAAARPVAQPLPTVATAGAIALVEPFVVRLGQTGGNGSYTNRVSEPLTTVCTKQEHGLVSPFLVPTNYGERPGQSPRCHDIEAPVPTVVATPTHAVVTPFLVSYYGTGGPGSVDEPLDTVTTRDRFGLVGGTVVDIRFRMLQPHELAAAMSFPADYRFRGNKAEVVRQIGNAVPVATAEALCFALLAKE